MTIRSHSNAESELTAALEYYQNISPKIARNFINDFEECLQRIQQFPTAWSPITPTLRRCHFKRFKYSIIYKIYTTEIFIVCVMHDKRKPGYWIERLTNQ